MKKKHLIGRIATVIVAAIFIVSGFEYRVYADDFDGDGIDDEYYEDAPIVGPGGIYDPDPEPIPYPDPEPVPAPTPVKRSLPYVDVDLTYRVVSCIPDNSVILFGEGTGWKECSGNYGISDAEYNVMYNICSSGAMFPIYVIAKGDGVTTADSDVGTTYVSINDFPKREHTKRDVPAATYDAATGMLSGIPECSKYSIDGGTSWSDYVSGNVKITGVSQHYEIMVVACGRTDTEDDSDAEIIWIEKSDPPYGVAPIHVSTVGGTGGINNVCVGEEFCVSGTGNWIDIGGNPVYGLNPGSYDVRIKAHGNYLASDIVTVTINGYTPVKEPTPTATFDGAHYRIGNLCVGMAYCFDRNNWTKITDGNCTSATITRAQAETAIANGGILVKKLSNGSTTIDSDIQTIVVTEAKAPVGLSIVPAASGGTGAIGNLSKDMEMSADKSNWYSLEKMSGSMVSGLKPGTYYVRRRANKTQICSDMVTVNLGSYSPGKEAKPSSVFNGATMTLSDVGGCQISLDKGKTWSKTITSSSVTLEEGKINLSNGIFVKRPGNGVSSADSDILIIPIGKQATPSGIGAVSATNSLGGAITGLTNAMEYRSEKSTTWTTPATANVTGLASGKYFVRTKGYGNALPSDMVVVTINVTTQATPSVPTVIIAPTPAPEKKTAAEDTSKQKSETKKDSAKEDGKKEKEESKIASDASDIFAEDEEAKEEEPVNAGTAPVLIGNPEIVGWGAIESKMNSEPLAIDMQSDTVIPASVIETAQATNTELVLDVSPNAAWSIAPQSVSSVSTDIDLGIKENPGDIPQELIKTITVNGEVEKEFSVNHEGKFGFVANLTLKFDASKSGKMANLYYYNKNSKKMELIDSAPVNSYGEATFSMDHASSYAVILAEQNVVSTGNDKSENKAADVTNKSTQKSNSKWWIWLVVAALVLTIAGLAVAVHIRKERIRELRRKRAERMMHDGVPHHPKK